MGVTISHLKYVGIPQYVYNYLADIAYNESLYDQLPLQDNGAVYTVEILRLIDERRLPTPDPRVRKWLKKNECDLTFDW